jgi:cobalt-zinc-cadmium efflux system protein
MADHETRLIKALIVTVLVLAVEVVGGIMSNSLALLSDAGHMLTDAFALGLSLIASFIMRRPSDYRATYGYQRVGLLAALVNGVSLVMIAIFIFGEVYRRIKAPPDVDTPVMIGVASLGLVGNLLMAWLLGGGHRDPNIRSAWLHVLGDAASSVGVIVAGLTITLTGWRIVDPLASVIVGALIIAGGGRVIKDALWVFLELSPAGFHIEEVSDRLRRIPGVLGIHDIHIWSIGHGTPAFSAHVLVQDQKISEVDAIRTRIECLLSELGIRHSVIQMECTECASAELLCEVRHPEETHRH